MQRCRRMRVIRDMSTGLRGRNGKAGARAVRKRELELELASHRGREDELSAQRCLCAWQGSDVGLARCQARANSDFMRMIDE